MKSFINVSVKEIILTIILIATPNLVVAENLPGNIADLVEQMGPSVVNLYSTKITKPTRNQGLPQFHDNQEIPDLLKKFFDLPMPENQPGHPQKSQSLGSGVIISADGYIVTNNHVVEGAEEIKVRCTNHEEYDAKIIGRDPKTDVALIKIEPHNGLTYVKFGDSDKIRVGEWVVAIGNPFGFENTVTAGIVSGKGRSFGSGPYENFIQTDASINLGNSGGPLFDLDGDLIGINSVIFSRSGGNIGLGFAIPVNMVKNVVDQLKEHGTVTRGWLGVMIQHVTADLADKFGLERPIGALVGEVMENSPADKAGIKQGDVIIEFMGREITAMTTLPSFVALTPVGTEAELTIIRKGKRKKIKITIGKLNEEQIATGSSASDNINRKLGLTVQEITPELAKTLGIKENEGLIISDIESSSPAAAAGIRRGEIILEVNQKPVESIKEFKNILREIKPEDNILLLTKRDKHT
ncbi:MAG: DegQ family serine endoprotease, partial [Desulfobulbaceae bacterium]|nr:DegQ family serine endoprotease [Desulfobulbaceae bacterium]